MRKRLINLLAKSALASALSFTPILTYAQAPDFSQAPDVGHGFKILQDVPTQLAPIGPAELSDSIIVNTLPVIDWFPSGRLGATARDALYILQQADAQGLSAKDYQVEALAGRFVQLENRQLDSAQVSALSQDLESRFIDYVLDLKNGRIKPEQVKQKFNREVWTRDQAHRFVADAIAQDGLDAGLKRVMNAIPMYQSLLNALAQYRALENHPAWATPLSGSANPGQNYKQMDILLARLQALGDISSTEALPASYSGEIVEAVRRFQQRHGFKGDGKLDKATITSLNVTPTQRVKQILLNIERLRWTPLTTGDRMIVVNIPEFILRAYHVNQGSIEPPLEMRVIVGRSFKTDTPLFDGQLSAIEFSPYWNIPISIARSETIPKIRANPSYLNASGMEFVLGNSVSTVASEANIQAVLSGKARIRQRPGPKNALGDIKFIFPNNQSIFLHHTPSVGLFDRSRRDLSHGCIRVEEPVELAQFVLERQTEWTRSRIENAMNGKKSSTIKVVEPVTVVLAYSTVVVKNKQVYFYNDIYGQDDLLAKVLAKRRP